MNDPLGDMLTRIRNAQMRNKSKVSTPASKLRERVLDVLKSEGYIRGYAVVEKRRPLGVRDRAEIFRRRAGDPRDRARFQARPPRLFLGATICRAVNNGLGIAILSTPKGVMADHDARDANVGGEVLCTVF